MNRSHRFYLALSLLCASALAAFFFWPSTDAPKQERIAMPESAEKPAAAKRIVPTS